MQRSAPSLGKDNAPPEGDALPAIYVFSTSRVKGNVCTWHEQAILVTGPALRVAAEPHRCGASAAIRDEEACSCRVLSIVASRALHWPSFPIIVTGITLTTMTTNDTVSDVRGQEQAALTKGQLQRIEERNRIEKRLREARRARWSLHRKRPASPSIAGEEATLAKAQNAQAAKHDTPAKSLEEVPLTPAQRQRLEEREHVEKVVREARRARWTFKRGKTLTAAEHRAPAKAKEETRLERSTRALVVAALMISVVLVGFSIHALVQRGALNRDLAGLVDQTKQLADQQATAISRVQTTLEQLAAAETAQVNQGAERLAKVEAATVAGLADVSVRLGKIDALTEAVNALAAQEAERARTETPTPPSAFSERELALSSGRRALLTLPMTARRAVLLIPGPASEASVAAADALRRVAEYLAARGSVVLRFDPAQATAEENLSTALEALEALLAQPEAAGKDVTVVAYGEGSSVAVLVSEARPEVANLVLLATTTPSAEPVQRMRQAVQVLGPIDENALGNLESWITTQDSPSP